MSLVSVTGSGTTRRVVITGSFDMTTAPEVRTKVRQVLREDAPSQLRLDLAAVDVLDDIAIGVLLGVRRLGLAQGCDVILQPKSASVVEALRAHGVDTLLH